MSSLLKELKDLIASGEIITIDKYMELALTHPEYGYYQKLDPFGSKGDFVTSPEISQIFGELICLFYIDIWHNMGRPGDINLIELGPGQGTLMRDFLMASQVVPEFSSAINLNFVEASKKLRNQQAVCLADLNYDISWYNNFNEVPDGIAFIIANEFFDALPIKQFIYYDNSWHERIVTFNDNGELYIGYFYEPISQEFIRDFFPKLIYGDVCHGDIVEISPIRDKLAKEMSSYIARNGGVALIIDYGHHISSFGDTLQAVKEHKYIDVLYDPGMADISSHVDFASIKEAMFKEEVNVSDIITQGDFLTGLGIELRAEKLCANINNKKKELINSEVHRLISPQEMGELFKVMLVTSGSIN